ncbi:MAG: Uncharacterized protein Athens101410_562 [Parcubacteria group bacterium Athens1014_10]|nr:MAG: Uncharacterized protein Athens101410_562 [Parcubacteria group bacterium Athens1014_10]TSD04665.1 MAG: Uncharacterized protein Athens071412_698 [Parcubacteria group bacterium Athens0714_12]
MEFKKHRFLYLIFVFIFLISAPLVIFYASGWRYDFKRNKITKTGSFAINTFPAEAKVYINGKSQKQSIFKKIMFYKKIFKTRQLGGLTPSLLTNFVPDEYLVEIKKENYQTWQKKLIIEKEKTTIIKNADLFLEKPEIELLTEKNIISQKMSPDQKKIAYLSEDKKNYSLEVIDLKNKKTNILYQSPSLESLISWSPDGENILIKEKSGDYLVIFLYNSKKTLSLKEFLPTNNPPPLFFEKKWRGVKWKNNSTILGLLGDDLYQINLIQKTSQFLYKIKNSDYLIKNNNLYYFSNLGGQTYLEEVNLSSKKIYPVTALPYSENYKFINITSVLIGAINEKNNFLFLINPLIREENKNIILKAEAKKWQFDSSDNLLIYNNDFEISIFNLKEKKKEIITRRSEEIGEAIFYYLSNSIIFDSKNSIYAIETDKRDRQNIFQLISVKKINDFYISDSPKILYLIGEIENKKGLYKITIQ